MKYLKLLTAFVAALFIFSGCYTQLAMRPSEYEREEEQVTVENEYKENYEDTSEYTTESEYNTDEESYYDDEGEINNYYSGSYYPYSRYYWGYHPGISIGFHW